MNLSDKDYREFHNQIFERNKELIKENRKLKDELEETETARMLCEENWKRCEQELECAKGDCKLIRDRFYEKASYVNELEERLRTANTKYHDIQKENDNLLTRIEKLEKDNMDVECVLNLEIDRLKSENKLLGQTLEDMHEQIGKLEEENQDLALANDTLVEELKEYSKKYENDGQLSNKEVNELLVDLGEILAGNPCSDLKITFNL